MKIVVLDGYTENPGDLSWGPIKALGDLTVYDRTSYEESPWIAERIGDADIVVVNKTPISRKTMEQCPNIRLIALLATGYNVVDCAGAKEKGIPVVNVPTYGTWIIGQYATVSLNSSFLSTTSPFSSKSFAASSSGSSKSSNLDRSISCIPLLITTSA